MLETIFGRYRDYSLLVLRFFVGIVFLPMALLSLWAAFKVSPDT